MKLNKFPVGILAVSLVFILALTLLDYAAMNLWHTYPTGQYRYWLAMGTVIVTFGCALSYVYWIGTTTKIRNPYIIPGIFFTVILLFVAGLLDIFFFLLARRAGEPYSFEVWSAQFKWFGAWGWYQQILWSSFFLLLIAMMWYLILKKKTKTGMIKHA